jgi:hypothetical protein
VQLQWLQFGAGLAMKIEAYGKLHFLEHVEQKNKK